MPVGEESTDPIDRALGDLPLPVPLTPEDVRIAVRAVVVHAAEEWPAGPRCRNDGLPYPCRLSRWGRRVLETHGLSERQVDALVRHGNPFVRVPFPFVVTGPTRVTRPGPYPARDPAVRTASPARPVARPGGQGRPAAPGVPAPRWPQAS
ncbi:hypothetical protein [Micromonospora cathayae]|uniref:Uncharacterized protein n=1 Tax=Micromonospora cathayae TaxID=3028804 RepID=A0ABY7ZW90_9ACTN|nr:hypothetical protein [Micromonospora sp. HUAS 3]WDZ87091.1 hypothetical protein PVK37_12125 [Micromonospora sp. HUAS 3]